MAARWRLKLFFASFILGSCWAHVEDEADSELAFGTTSQNQPRVGSFLPRRFLLYDVNLGEGFNLRRDVYMRVANLVKNLRNQGQDWTLVLPPWGRVYHWKSKHIKQFKLPWSTFFDTDSLRLHVPVIEFKEYIDVIGRPHIDEIVYLQHYKEGWTNGKWEEKVDVANRECNDPPAYQPDEDGVYRGWFWGFSETFADRFRCLSVQGFASVVVPFLVHNTTPSRSIFMDRAEILLHDAYGQKEYWNARRSMRFAKPLREIGDQFRATHLMSTDEKDKTEIKADWFSTMNELGSALGGPYLAIHLRRKDFTYAHGDKVPSLQNAARQIQQVMDRQQDLLRVFVATDAPPEEIQALKDLLPNKVVLYEPSPEVLKKYKDGGIAIIDQWICAHARYFMGTALSTFSFRIHEEREILGFSPKTTYNCFCKEMDEHCEQPSHWKIVY